MDFGMIAANELDKYVEDGEAFIIDLRIPEEYRRCHIKGAVNIPYGRLGQCRELPRGRTLVLYCERGAVSMVAAKELAARGYRVKTVIGGIHAYREIFD
ncbi:rhodanese-like domain-containing protein [Lachnospiraceae bacterium 46-15]